MVLADDVNLRARHHPRRGVRPAGCGEAPAVRRPVRRPASNPSSGSRWTWAATSATPPEPNAGRWPAATAAACSPAVTHRSSWCDAHHVTRWEHNGPTDITNLALLCRHHHGVTHRSGWTMTARPARPSPGTPPTAKPCTANTAATDRPDRHQPEPTTRATTRAAARRVSAPARTPTTVVVRLPPDCVLAGHLMIACRKHGVHPSIRSVVA